MNIIVITNSYPNKSKPYAGKHVERHVGMHRQAGAKVKVYSPDDSRSGPIFTTIKYLRLAFIILWAAVSQPVDLVHAQWVLPAGLFGAFIAAVHRKPFVVTSHGAFTNKFEKRNPVIRALVSFVIGQADKIIAVGYDQQEKIERVFNLPAGSVACINMGVLIPDKKPTRQDARQKLGLQSDKKIILFIGNLLKRKGPDLLVEAMAKMEDTADLQVFIGGQGPESGPLAEQINNLGLQDIVSIIGLVEPEDVPVWMAAADICVVPSRDEPFGLVAIESLAVGTPVIAAEVGGLIESIQPGYNGLLFPVDDVDALSANIQKLLVNPELREQMAAVGANSIQQHDMSLQAEKVFQIYQSLLSKQS